MTKKRRKPGSSRSSKRTRLRHFNQRADERTPVQAEELKRLVGAGEFLRVERQSKTRTLCVCKVDDVPVWFTFSNVQKVPVTVLPQDSQRITDAIESNPDLPKWVKNHQKSSTGNSTEILSRG